MDPRLTYGVVVAKRADRRRRADSTPSSVRESIEDGAALARAESLTESGKPRSVRALVEGAALAQRYRETVVMSSPPPAVQRLLFPLLARFASSNPEPAAVR